MTTMTTDHGNITAPDAGDLNTAARKYAASQGWAMPDGSYPIRPVDNHGQADLQKAIHAVGRGSGSHGEIRAHIKRRASALGLSDMIPDDWTSSSGGPAMRLLTDFGFEILTRNTAVVADVKPKLGQVDMIAAPWEEFAQVVWQDQLWNERYMRGCFDGYEEQCNRTRVNREHKIGDTIGKIIWADTKHQDGMILRTQLAKTPRGEEALQLAMDDMISGSLGYYTAKPSDVRLDRRAMRRDVLRGLVDHFAFVEQPAYIGAGVVGVRDRNTPHTSPRHDTPSLDEFMSDPLLEWARNQSST